jgi:RNA polymerase sigma-70 factor (ECF subfamily)
MDMDNNSLRPEDSIIHIINRHEDRVFRTALAVLGNWADAEDIVQETFLRLLTKAPEFASPEHERAWLIKVTVNLCRSRLRSAWFRKTVPLLDSHPAESSEDRGLVEAILALPAKYRTVIHLYYYEGYSTGEIGELTGQRAATVRSLLARARQKLKLMMEEK